MTKIYLAKSNRSNPDDVSRVRQVLSEYKDIEVVEFKGGAYSHKDLLSCELLLIIPNLLEINEDEDCIPLGKGLHEQIVAFTSKGNSKSNIHIVYEVSNASIMLTQFQELDLSDDADYINYSVAVVDFSVNGKLETFIKNRFRGEKHVKSTSTSISHSDYMYLLIGR